MDRNITFSSSLCCPHLEICFSRTRTAFTLHGVQSMSQQKFPILTIPLNPSPSNLTISVSHNIIIGSARIHKSLRVYFKTKIYSITFFSFNFINQFFRINRLYVLLPQDFNPLFKDFIQNHNSLVSLLAII